MRKKSADKPLWKHIREKHDGRMEVEMFEHFRMELTGIFSSAQRRKANEGVRIAHLDPNTRMNSKDEFRQGTNIIMQPVRVINFKPASLWREGVANAKIANAANIKEGPRSFADHHHLQHQECCQAPPCARSLPGPGHRRG